MFQFEMATLVLITTNTAGVVPAFINMLNMFFCRYKQGRKLSWGLHWIFPVVSHLCQNHSLKLCSVAWQCCRLAWLDLIPSLSPQTWLETVRNSCLGLSSNTSSGFIFINIETQAETLVSGLAALSYSLTRPRSPPLLSISKRWENVPTSWKKKKKQWFHAYKCWNEVLNCGQILSLWLIHCLSSPQPLSPKTWMECLSILLKMSSGFTLINVWTQSLNCGLSLGSIVA